MERLILLRHGKAESDAASGQDFDRALAERGRRDTAIVVRALAEAGFKPDLVLVSPALRTWQTWEVAEPFFPDAAARRAAALYNIEADRLLDLARAEGEAARTVMVTVHSPAHGQLASSLAERNDSLPELRTRLALGFPTAAAAVIDFAACSVRFFTPKDLGGGA